METQQYLERLNSIQQKIISFLLNEENPEEDFQNFMNTLDQLNIKRDSHETKEVLYLISKIADNYHRNQQFIQRIEKIILLFSDVICQNFSNMDIFRLFKRNKQIILFLLENKLLKINESLTRKLCEKKYEPMKYQQYFYPEIRTFISKELDETIKNEVNTIDNFLEKRKEGENDSYICQLIRDDTVDDFVRYINQRNIKLSSNIPESIFETNSFLIGKETSLIEYAAFFGSIQIFKFLFINNRELLTPSLWLFAIHGKNPEIIHVLEDNHIDPQDKSYENCIIESIKCHHNEIANYLLTQQSQIAQDSFFILQSSLQYHNYAFFPSIFTYAAIFYYICKYDYFKLVEFQLKTNNVDVNTLIIHIIFI